MELLPENDTTRFELLNGQPPVWLLDRHPDGRLVALQIQSLPAARAAIWDMHTGALVWHTPNAIAMAWTRDGAQIVLVRETYVRLPDHPSWIIGEAQAEITHCLERLSWPDGQPVGSLTARLPTLVRLPTGWVDSVAVSPRGNLVAVRWLEQDCAGLELVALRADGDQQCSNAGYLTRPNHIQGPVFSPDGRFLVLSVGRYSWWNDDDGMLPSPGGRLEVGHIAVLDLDAGTVRERTIEEDIPIGWLPQQRHQMEAQLLGIPRFESPPPLPMALDLADPGLTVAVDLPTGQTRYFAVES